MTHSNKSERLTPLDLPVLRVIHYTQHTMIAGSYMVWRRMPGEEGIAVGKKEVYNLLKSLVRRGLLREIPAFLKRQDGSMIQVVNYKLTRKAETVLRKDDMRPIRPRIDAS